MKNRLDKELMLRDLAETRSQAENYIKLGYVLVNNKIVQKAGFLVSTSDKIEVSKQQKYVSRAGFKLESVADDFCLNFKNKTVLDVGSSTGGFTDLALQRGAKMVYAVDVGTNQLHPKLLNDERVKVYEKTDIRDFSPEAILDVVVIDVSFVSLRQILPSVAKISGSNTEIVAMLKPQFEASKKDIGRSGVIKNNTIRRKILKDFEAWASDFFVIKNKADSKVKGLKGNLERFYLLKKTKN